MSGTFASPKISHNWPGHLHRFHDPMIDALNAAEQLRTEFLGRAQIEAADRVIMTKVDAVPDSVLATVVATVSHLNPGAGVVAAVKGQPFVLPELPTVVPYNLPQLAGSDAPIQPTRIEITEDVDWAIFSVWLSALLYARGDNLVRVKGVLKLRLGPCCCKQCVNPFNHPNFSRPRRYSARTKSFSLDGATRPLICAIRWIISRLARVRS